MNEPVRATMLEKVQVSNPFHFHYSIHYAMTHFQKIGLNATLNADPTLKVASKLE